MCQALQAKCKCSSSFSSPGCTQLMRTDLCICVLQYAWDFTPPQRKKAALGQRPTLKDNTWRKSGLMTLSFFPMNVLSPLSASGGLNYLSRTRKETLKDRTMKMESAQREMRKHTHTYSHVRLHPPPNNPRTCRNVYINTLTHTHRALEHGCTVQ